MATIPYMQLYVADYLADTQHLTTEEHGAYILLLMNQWHTEKPIPANRLARIARLSNERWTSVEITLNEFFDIDPETGLWSHPRVEKELERVYAQSLKNSKAGKKSAKVRRAKAIEKAKKSNERSTSVSTNVPTKPQQNVNHKDKDKDKDKSLKTLSGKKRIAQQCLEYLNEKAGRKYKPTDTNLNFIIGRMREGFPEEDIKWVIDAKVAAWKNTDMDQYLRPATLFNATKFNQYIGEKGMKEIGTDKAWYDTATGIRAKGKEFGIDENEFDSFPMFKSAVVEANRERVRSSDYGKGGI